MRVCLVVEGAYPYVQGGVSNWLDTMVSKMPHYEFVVQSIAATRSDSGRFKYTFPPNLSVVNEAFLQDDDMTTRRSRKLHLNKRYKDAIRSLVFSEDEQWETVFELFSSRDISANDLLMGRDFFEMVYELYKRDYYRVVFTDFLWTLRSVFLPIFLILKNKPIEADLYHSLSTGYAGIMSCYAGYLYNKPIMLTEHGIYTREREEEIIRSSWTKGIYKDLWINHFYMLSKCIYQRASKVCALFDHARGLQIQIGCPEEKTETIHNGVDVAKFGSLPLREPDGFVNIGAIVRVTPIKDIKTMLNAYHLAKQKQPHIRLHIIGSTEEDPFYYQECLGLIEMLNIQDVTFTGHVNTLEYMKIIDVVILTSISEGQPLSLLEAMMAGRPCISTSVGDCYDMMNAGDEENRAGIVVPVMNVGQISRAIQTLAESPSLRKKMGANGQHIVRTLYDGRWFIQRYHDIYLALLEVPYRGEVDIPFIPFREDHPLY